MFEYYGNIKQLFHGGLVNSQNYCPEVTEDDHGGLLPEAILPRAIVHRVIRGTEGQWF